MQLLKAFVTSLLVTAAVAAKVQGADKRQAGECDDQLCRTTVRDIYQNLPSRHSYTMLTRSLVPDWADERWCLHQRVGPLLQCLVLNSALAN